MNAYSNKPFSPPIDPSDLDVSSYPSSNIPNITSSPSWSGADTPSHKKVIALMAAGGVFGLHKYLLSSQKGYAEGLYHFIKNVEERSPSRIFRTFALSQWMSSYISHGPLGKSGNFGLFLKPEELFQGPKLTPMGEQIQRLIGLDPLEF